MPKPLLQETAGKRQGQTLVVTSVTGQNNTSRLLLILDTMSQCRFLVDTGAEVSLLPPTSHLHKHATATDHGFSLLAANGSSIHVFGNHLPLILDFIENSSGFYS